MKDSEIDIRRKVDLHYNRKDYSGNNNYVEFAFNCCGYEILNIPNSYWPTSLNGNELYEIFSYLKINVDKSIVERGIIDRSCNDVEVFHSADDEQVFAYFDFYKDPTDQNDMFYLGVSCNKLQEEFVHDKLLKIFKKLNTSSPFTYDIWNHTLYYKVFLSYFYFYNSRVDENDRRMYHHY
jgi:hypothetical protein